MFFAIFLARSNACLYHSSASFGLSGVSCDGLSFESEGFGGGGGGMEWGGGAWSGSMGGGSMMGGSMGGGGMIGGGGMMGGLAGGPQQNMQDMVQQLAQMMKNSPSSMNQAVLQQLQSAAR